MLVNKTSHSPQVAKPEEHRCPFYTGFRKCGSKAGSKCEAYQGISRNQTISRDMCHGPNITNFRGTSSHSDGGMTGDCTMWPDHGISSKATWRNQTLNCCLSSRWAQGSAQNFASEHATSCDHKVHWNRAPQSSLQEAVLTNAWRPLHSVIGHAGLSHILSEKLSLFKIVLGIYLCLVASIFDVGICTYMWCFFQMCTCNLNKHILNSCQCFTDVAAGWQDLGSTGATNKLFCVGLHGATRYRGDCWKLQRSNGVSLLQGPVDLSFMMLTC